jgi:hypothetical protein
VSFLVCGSLVPAVVAASNVTDLTMFVSGTNGYRVIGAENSLAGRMIATLGDLNNDGYDDFVVGLGYFRDSADEPLGAALILQY